MHTLTGLSLYDQINFPKTISNFVNIFGPLFIKMQCEILLTTLHLLLHKQSFGFLTKKQTTKKKNNFILIYSKTNHITTNSKPSGHETLDAARFCVLSEVDYAALAPAPSYQCTLGPHEEGRSGS